MVSITDPVRPPAGWAGLPLSFQEQTYLRNPSDDVIARATELYAELDRRGRYQGIVEAL